MSPKQATCLEALRARHDLVEVDLAALAGKPVAALDRAEASALIQWLLDDTKGAIKRAAMKARGQVDMFAAGEVDERGPPPRRIAGVGWPDTARRGRPRWKRFQQRGAQ